MPRRSSKKPSMKRAKKMVSKQHLRRAKSNQDNQFIRVRTEGTLTPQQGALVSNYIYAGYTMGPASASSLYDNAEFNLWTRIYDRFRVNRVHVTVTPKANVLGADAAQNDAALTLSGSGVVHTVIDRDSIAPSSIAQLSRYPSYKKYSTLKKFKRSYGITYPKGVWLDCQNAVPSVLQHGDALGALGGITMYAENFIEDAGEIFNEPWAEVIVEWDIVFQGKTIGASLAGVYDGDTLVGVKMTDNTQYVPYALTPLTGVRGTLNDRRVTVTDGSAPEAVITDAPDQ